MAGAREADDGGRAERAAKDSRTDVDDVAVGRTADGDVRPDDAGCCRPLGTSPGRRRRPVYLERLRDPTYAHRNAVQYNEAF